MVKPSPVARRVIRWSIFFALLLAAILIPFALFGARLEASVSALLGSQRTHQLLPLALAGLLASDIVLPVPSSVVSTACGRLLGFLPGLLVSTVGMTVGCALGYGLGRAFGRPAAVALVGAGDLAAAEGTTQRGGLWAVFAMRPVPVLAESSVIVAGVMRVPFLPFMGVTTVANVGISTAYAFAGSLSVRGGVFLLVFVAALLVPGAAMLVARRLRRKNRSSV